MTSVNYPQMYNRDDFGPQHITVTDGDYLILSLDDLDLPPPLTQPDAPLEANSVITSCYEYIRVYEIDADQNFHDMAILCGNIDQYDSLSRSIISVFGKDVYIHMNFDLETPEASRFIGRGYRILYTAGYLDCNTETFDPTVTSISPGIGILAGGTRLTLTGCGFIPEIVMSYGDYATTSSELCSLTTCFVTTPAGKSVDVGIELPISLIFRGQEPVTTSFTFTYQPNPEVNSIYPLKTLVAGGTTLTVQGEGFEAVNEPRLMVHVVHTTIRTIRQLNDNQNDNTFTSSCVVDTSDILKCLTPKLDIPEQFKHTADDAPENSAADDDYTWNIEGQSLEFEMGLTFDADDTYADLSQSLPQYSQLKVYILEPELDRFTETREVNSKDHLQITGKRFTDGLDITDYAVKIGTGTCDVIDLTVNELICVIPTEEGQQQEDGHKVLVHPGTNLSPQLIGNSIIK